MESRRSVVFKLITGVFVGAVARPGVLKAWASDSRDFPSEGEETPTPTDDGAGEGASRDAGAPGRGVDPELAWRLVAPLERGSGLGDGWILHDASGILAGAVVVTLMSALGRTERVHICRREGPARGVTSTVCCDLLVMNEGATRLPTDEALACAVTRLGVAVGRNEASPAAAPTIAGLLTHDERIARFSAPGDGSLR